MSGNLATKVLLALSHMTTLA